MRWLFIGANGLLIYPNHTPLITCDTFKSHPLVIGPDSTAHKGHNFSSFLTHITQSHKAQILRSSHSINCTLSLSSSPRMKVTVVTRSGRELVRGGLDLNDSVCYIHSFSSIVFSIWLIYAIFCFARN